MVIYGKITDKSGNVLLTFTAANDTQSKYTITFSKTWQKEELIKTDQTSSILNINLYEDKNYNRPCETKNIPTRFCFHVYQALKKERKEKEMIVDVDIDIEQQKQIDSPDKTDEPVALDKTLVGIESSHLLDEINQIIIKGEAYPEARWGVAGLILLGAGVAAIVVGGSIGIGVGAALAGAAIVCLSRAYYLQELHRAKDPSSASEQKERSKIGRLGLFNPEAGEQDRTDGLQQQPKPGK